MIAIKRNILFRSFPLKVRVAISSIVIHFAKHGATAQFAKCAVIGYRF
jgi:hypothetical protein